MASSTPTDITHRAVLIKSSLSFTRPCLVCTSLSMNLMKAGVIMDESILRGMMRMVLMKAGMIMSWLWGWGLPLWCNPNLYPGNLLTECPSQCLHTLCFVLAPARSSESQGVETFGAATAAHVSLCIVAPGLTMNEFDVSCTCRQYRTRTSVTKRQTNCKVLGFLHLRSASQKQG